MTSRNASRARSVSSTHSRGSRLKGAVIAAIAIVAALPAEARELSYQDLFEAYVSTHADQLETPAFAWQRFLIEDAPRDCRAARYLAHNPLAFEDLLQREMARLPRRLAAAKTKPTRARGVIEGRIILDDYDRSRGVFPVLRVQSRPFVDAPRACGRIMPSGARGLSAAAPDRFTFDIAEAARVLTEIPMPEHEVRRYYETHLDFQRPQPTLDIALEVEVGPMPLGPKGKHGMSYEAPVRVVGASVSFRRSGEVFHRFSPELFEAALQSPRGEGHESDADSAAAAVADSNALAPMRNYTLAFEFFRSFPQVATADRLEEFTAELIRSERQQWALVFAQTQSRIAMRDRSLNLDRPIAAYEWQTLADHDPAAAAAMLDAFLARDSALDFYENDPRRNPGLDDQAIVTVFDHRQIGVEPPEQGERYTPPRIVDPQTVAALSSVAARHLAAVAAAAPRLTRADFKLSARYDADTRRLELIGGRDVETTPEGVSAWRRIATPTFVSGGEEFDRGGDLVPAGVDGSALYEFDLPRGTTSRDLVPRRKPKMRGGNLDDWRVAVTRLAGDWSVPTLAIDRPILFTSVEIAQEAAEHAMAASRMRSGQFDVIGRVVMQLEGIDYAVVSTRRNPRQFVGALRARTVSLELLDLEGRPLARLPLPPAVEKTSQKGGKGGGPEGAADILGIRLGMPMAEAEALARAHLPAARIRQLDPSKLVRHEPTPPFTSLLSFADLSTGETLTLFQTSESDGRLAAASRVLSMPEGYDVEQAIAVSLEKYGAHPLILEVNERRDNAEAVWADAFGELEKPRDTDVERFRYGSCAVDFTTFQAKTLRAAEGEPEIPSRQRRSEPWVLRPNVKGGKIHSPVASERGWDPEQWRGCGPTVLVRAREQGRGRPVKLSVLLVDLSLYADFFGAPAREADVAPAPEL